MNGKLNNPSWCCDRIEELISEYKDRLASLGRQTSSFSEREAGRVEGQESVLEEVIEHLATILYE